MRPARVLLILLPLICLCHGQHAEVGDLDPLDGMDEQEFEVIFTVSNSTLRIKKIKSKCCI